MSEKAFPAPYWNDDRMMYLNQGMTLRDYFAAKAMRIAYDHFARDLESENQQGHDFEWDELHEGGGYCIVVAEASYAMADAMLKAREQ